MKIIKSRINIYFIFFSIFLYALYDVLNSASAGNDNTNRSIVYVFLFIIIGDMIFYFLHLRKKTFIKTEVAMIIYNIYILLNPMILKGGVSREQFICFMLGVWWLFTIIFWRNNLKKNSQTYELINKFIDIMFIFYTIVILYSSVNIVANFSTEYARVGYIYHLLSIFPFVLLKKNSRKKQLFIGITYVMTFLSFKRGAIIVLPISHLLYILIEREISIKKVLKVVISIFFLLSVFLIFDNYTDGYLSSRFSLEELSDGSGRADVKQDTINNLKKRNLIQLMFGIKNSSEQALETGIHNEILTQLYSYGVFGLILYIAIFFNILFIGIRLSKKIPEIKAAFFSMFVYTVLIGLVSGLYFVHSTYYIMMFIGVIYGFKYKKGYIQRGYIKENGGIV